MRDIPQTERSNPRTADLDLLPTQTLVHVLLDEQRTAAECVAQSAGLLAEAVDEIARRMREGGALHYVGAGTSGRLGVLDASECPPTFRTDPASHQASGEQQPRDRPYRPQFAVFLKSAA